MYRAINLKAAEQALEDLKTKWKEDYPRAVKVWEENFGYVSHLFNYPSDIRKVMYTTNAIESVNSSLRKVTKKCMYENHNVVFKVFFLRITVEPDKKWNNSRLRNWPKVLNQLSCLEETCDRIARFVK